MFIHVLKQRGNYELHVYKLTFQLIPVLSKVKDSMDKMVSFSPEDVIFLLNKWDTISHEDVEQQETYIEKTKKCLHQIWKKVDDSCIFKFSAKKVLKDNFISFKRKTGENQYRLSHHFCKTNIFP